MNFNRLINELVVLRDLCRRHKARRAFVSRAKSKSAARLGDAFTPSMAIFGRCGKLN